MGSRKLDSMSDQILHGNWLAHTEFELLLYKRLQPA
jgi:hypothetical protein